MEMEELDRRLLRIKTQHALVMAILKKRGVTSFYNAKVSGIFNRVEPQLQPRCVDLIKEAGIHTLAYGSNERLDFLKNYTFMILGKCLGKNLESW